MKRLIAGLAAALAVIVGLFTAGAVRPSNASVAPGECGPMDVAFVIDTTGSMGGAIGNVKVEVASLIADIDTASGGDFQLGLVTFKDDVSVVDDLAPGAGTIAADILALTASGGGAEPEASDEALNTVVNGLDMADRLPGQQTGDFNGVFRPAAVKIVVLVTDARPAGFDDTFTPGVDDVNAHNRALDAASAGIKISAVFVPTLGAPAGAITPIMTDYATTTGGLFLTTAADGSGTAGAISDIIDACGGVPPIASCAGQPATIVGTSGDDAISGTKGDDVIDGLGGNDVIEGGPGDDCLNGGDGIDQLKGGPGADQHFGGAARDRIRGGPENDELNGEEGDDALKGGHGDDAMTGEEGDDALKGGHGDDAMNGGADTDLCAGGHGTDTATECEDVSGVP